MKKPISQDQIKRYTNVLNECNDLMKVNQFNSSRLIEICTKHNANRAILFHANKLDFFDNPSRGAYKSKYSRFDPIHAKILIERQKKHDIDNRKIKDKEKKPLLKKSTVPQNKSEEIIKDPESVLVPSMKPISEPKIKSKINVPKPRKKTVSLFWGLITWSL